MKIQFTKKTVLASALVASGSAMADTGTATDYAAQAFSTLQAQVTNLGGYAWTMVVAIVGITVGIKLFKKFVSRAS
ncbi:major coat protein [Dickeya zeae]|jgi:hypothetical protein|uniref:Phage coat protein n=1 Tax=Dickeya zeae TaxID=204042 RepID=A0ABX8VX84_9GAMM|nr:major coat protein [Dickeya zeae]QYM90987.1 phage coat protein [Dickeya zeae]QYM90998.1 phage coat protein [Dickeya zeae]